MGHCRVAVARAPAELETKPFAALLREDLDASEIKSVRELGKRIAERIGTETESERRGLQRYLKGEVQPTPEKAVVIAEVLGVDPARYEMAATLQPSLQELLREISGRLDELAEELRKRDERLLGARARNRVVARLEALEERVATEGQAMRTALEAIRDVLADPPANGAVTPRSEGRSATPRRRRRVAK